MSSYWTTISVNDKEWARIQKCVQDTDKYVIRQQERAERLRQEAERRQALLEEIRQQTKRTVDSAVKLLQGDFEKAVKDLSGTAREAAGKQTGQFVREIEDLRADISATGRRTAAAAGQISRLSQEFNRALAELAGQRSGAAERAGVFLQELNGLCGQIEGLNPGVFAPEKYRELAQIVRNADADTRSGSHQAALIAAQNGVTKASALLAELILANEEYDALLAETAEKAEAVRARFDALSPEMEGVIAFDLDGEPMEFEYDIDHWSGGCYGRLRDEFRQLYDRVEAAKKTKVPAARLEALRGELERLGLRLEQCDADARQELAGSLRAQEIAARWCDSLQGNDWKLEEHGFEGDDDRSPYTMTYQDGAGNKIAIIVSPDTSADQPHIVLEAFPKQEAHGDVIKRNVQALLADEGIRVERTRHMEDCHRNSDEAAFLRNALPKVQAQDAARRKKKFGTA